MKLRSFVWILFGIVLMATFAYATTFISDSRIDSPILNTSDTNYKVSRSADVVVCRGTSTLDDLYKAVTCDVVCKSTDSDCANEITGQSGYVEIRSGFYNVGTDIVVNGSLIGKGNVTLNFSNTFNFNSIAGSNPINVKIQNLQLQGTLPGSTRDYSTYDALFNLTGYNSISNFEISNIKITNYNGTAIHLSLDTSATGNATNLNLLNIDLLDVRDGIRVMQDGSEGESRVQNVKIENYNIINTAYYAAFYPDLTKVGYGIYGTGIDGCTIENVRSRKAADGPTVFLYRTKNCYISNIVSLDQHDYAVSIADSSKNIEINNIYSLSPQYYGPLYLHTPNYATPQVQENIHASNLYCLNCTGQGTGYHPIWINVDDSDDSGGNKIRNVVIENFLINGSASHAAIQLDALDGEIDNVKIRDGRISNPDHAGIRFQKNYTISNVVIENIVFENIGKAPANDDLNTSIYFQYANTSNINLINNNFINQRANNTFVFYAHSTGSPQGFLDVYGINNKRIRNIKVFLNVGDYYFDNYNYTGAIGSRTCSTSSVYAGNTIFNSSTQGRCVAGTWKYTVFT